MEDESDLESSDQKYNNSNIKLMCECELIVLSPRIAIYFNRLPVFCFDWVFLIFIFI